MKCYKAELPDFNTEGEENFEDLLTQISTLFINLPLDYIDDVLVDTQKRICQCMGLDSSILWLFDSQNPELMTITHLYAPEDFPQIPEKINGKETHPYLYKKLMAGEVISFSNDDLPAEATIDVSVRRKFGVESSVAIPLYTSNSRPIGVLAFDTINRSKEWSKLEVKRLKLVADIFSNTLARKNSELDLEGYKAKLSLAIESAEAGVWEYDISTNSFWVTNQARKLFDYSSEEIITMELFERTTVHEDWPVVSRAIAECLEKNQPLQVEYRIHLKDGATRWICSRGRPYYNADGSPCRILGISADVTDRMAIAAQLKMKLAEIEELKQQIEFENFYLRQDLQAEMGLKNIIGNSKQFNSAFSSAKQVAATDATVLLLGETGSGKGVFASAIHSMSERNTRPFVTVNCAALPPNLIESELFGREKGAFTGANTTRPGRFQVADKGTIFLDEIGELALEMQAKLLRVLQEGEFEMLGSSVTRRIDVRILAATGRDLKKEVENGRFRQDLFYRLNVFPVSIPPLRERKDDIPLLAQFFVEKFSHKMGKKIDKIPKRMLQKLIEYHWPGNIRELEHLIERSVINTPGNTLLINDQLLNLSEAASDKYALEDLQTIEKEHIDKVLKSTNWKIEGAKGAAAILKINPSTLRFRLKKLGLKRPA